MKTEKYSKLMFVVSLFFSLFLLAACNSDSEETSNSNKTTDEQETFTLRYNVSFQPPLWDWDPKYKSTEEFAKLVEERTDGRVKIELFYANQLAGQVESLDALSRGTFDIQNITPSAWASKIPEGSFAALPYGWMGEEHAAHLLRETDVGKLYEEALDEYGVKLISYWYSGATGYLSKSPIAAPEDFKGLIFNTTDATQQEYYQSMGAGIAGVPFAEYYEGLLRGTIDTVLFPYNSLETYKLAEVVESVTVPGSVMPSFGLVAFSKSSWEKLPSDIQEIITETALELEQAGIEGSKELTKLGIEYAESQGLEIVHLKREDYDEFLKLGQEKVWDKFASRNERTKKMTEVLYAENKKWIEENPKAQEYFDEYLAD